MKQEVIHTDNIEKKIYIIRNQKVMLDSALAKVYGVTTARLNQQVRRNIDRFPDDFMFQLNKEEFKVLMLQFATSKTGSGGRRKLPFVFTEHGALMAANVLNSERAIHMSVIVVRAFVKLREFLSAQKELAQKLAELERKLEKHDDDIHSIFEAIRSLMKPPDKAQKKIGFTINAAANIKNIKSRKQ